MRERGAAKQGSIHEKQLQEEMRKNYNKTCLFTLVFLLICVCDIIEKRSKKLVDVFVPFIRTARNFRPIKGEKFCVLFRHFGPRLLLGVDLPSGQYALLCQSIQLMIQNARRSVHLDALSGL